jgi:hypothetical protein
MRTVRGRASLKTSFENILSMLLNLEDAGGFRLENRFALVRLRA